MIKIKYIGQAKIAILGLGDFVPGQVRLVPEQLALELISDAEHWQRVGDAETRRAERVIAHPSETKKRSE